MLEIVLSHVQCNRSGSAYDVPLIVSWKMGECEKLNVIKAAVLNFAILASFLAHRLLHELRVLQIDKGLSDET